MRTLTPLAVSTRLAGLASYSEVSSSYCHEGAAPDNVGSEATSEKGGVASVGPMHCDVPPTHERSGGGLTRILKMLVVLKGSMFGFCLDYVLRCVDQVTLMHSPGSLLSMCPSAMAKLVHD